LSTQPLCTSLLAISVSTICWCTTREHCQWQKKKMSLTKVSVTWILLSSERVLFLNWEWDRKRKEDFRFFFCQFLLSLSIFGFSFSILFFKKTHRLISWTRHGLASLCEFVRVYRSTTKIKIKILCAIPLIFAFKTYKLVRIYSRVWRPWSGIVILKLF